MKIRHQNPDQRGPGGDPWSWCGPVGLRSSWSVMRAHRPNNGSQQTALQIGAFHLVSSFRARDRSLKRSQANCGPGDQAKPSPITGLRSHRGPSRWVPVQSRWGPCVSVTDSLGSDNCDNLPAPFAAPGSRGHLPLRASRLPYPHTPARLALAGISPLYCPGWWKPPPLPLESSTPGSLEMLAITESTSPPRNRLVAPPPSLSSRQPEAQGSEGTPPSSSSPTFNPQLPPTLYPLVPV